MNMKTTQLFIYIFLAATLLLVACGKSSSRQVIDEAFELVYVQPDSAAWLLENKIIPASLTDSDKADYWYLLTLSHLQERRSTVNDSLIAYSVQYYKDHSRFDLLFYACRFAYWQANDKQLKESFLQDAVAEAERSGDTIHLARAYGMQADFFYKERRYEEVIDACRRLIAIAPDERADAWYVLGLNYGRMGCEDSSLYYMSEAADLAWQMKDPLAEHYLRNYVDALSHSYPRKALEKYHLLVERYPDKQYAATALGIWQTLGQKDSVDHYLSLMENGLMIDPNPWYITRNVLTKAQRAYWRTQNGAPFDVSELAQFVDSTSVAAMNLVKDEKERVRMQNKLLIDNQRLEVKRQQTLTVLFALLFIFTVLGSVTFFYIRNKREKLLATEEKLDALQQLLREVTAVRIGTDDSSALPDSHFFRKVLLQQLGIIRLVATAPTEQNKELLQQMANIANNETQTDALLIWEDLYPIIDAVYDNFHTRLLGFASGRLSEKELQLCCLLRADFSTKEISVVTQQSVRTIYQRKTNIRHALGMNEKDDIVSFIEYSGEVSSSSGLLSEAI